MQPYHDYRSLTPEAVTSAIEDGLASAEAHIAAATSGRDAGSFDTVIVELSEAARAMWNAAGRSAVMSNLHPDVAVRDAATDALRRFRAWADSLAGRPEIATTITRYAATDEARVLTGERRRVLDLWVRDVERAGSGLDEERLEEVSTLRARCADLASTYQRNIFESTVHADLADAELATLPDHVVRELATDEKTGSRRVEANWSQIEAVLRHSSDRTLRERVLRIWVTRSPENRPVIEELLAARRRLAAALGFASWSDYANRARMSGSADAVRAFLDDAERLLHPAADAELEALERMADGNRPLQSYDRWYLEEQQRARLGADPHLLEPFLPLEAVLDGLFGIANEVFGVRVTEAAESWGWHPSVRLFQMHDEATGEHCADVYFDLFGRRGKSATAFVDSLRLQDFEPDGTRRPGLLVLAASLPPVSEGPVLLAQADVEVLFHEFGHALEFGLSKATIAEANPAWIEWDFVEAPSQIMEHWTWEPDVLARFARHHETGAPPPRDLLEAIGRTRNLNAALDTLWWLVVRARLDQALHGPEPVDMDAAYREAFAASRFPFLEGTHLPTCFNHIGGGYDAGFYAYLWARVRGDDMFKVFRDGGLLSPEIGRRYRQHVLEPSWTRPAADRLRGFLEREPSMDAFLERFNESS